MKNFLVVLIFVMGEITIGKALRCQQCKAIGAEDCSGDSVECENENDFCTQQIEINSLRGDKRITASRGCSNLSAACTDTYIMNSRTFLLLINTKCCCEDDCNSEKMEMPEPNTTENGVMCKSCQMDDSYECEPNETFACTGNAKHCLAYSGTAIRPCGAEKRYAFIGCASKLTCDYTTKALVGTMAYNRTNIECLDKYRLL